MAIILISAFSIGKYYFYNVEKAKALNPLYIRTELGRPVYLYENVETEKLREFGEVHPPAIADLFLALMKKNKEGEDK